MEKNVLKNVCNVYNWVTLLYCRHWHDIVNQLYSCKEKKCLTWAYKILSWPSMMLNDKESPCQCRRHKFNLWSRKIPHVSEQISPCSTPTELVLWSPGAATTESMCSNCWSPHLPPSLCSATREATEMRSLGSPLESSPRFQQLEKSLSNHKEPAQPQIDQENYFKNK